MPIHNQAQNVVVIGHLNPDTDSVCSALAYAELKNRKGDLTYEARRAGTLSRETEFVLNHFGVREPRLCTDVLPKIRNVEYRHMDGIPRDASMREAWEKMKEASVDTVAVVSEERELEGLITVQDIAVANMDVFDNSILAKTGTTYHNILKTLSGKMIIGSEDDIVHENARVLIGTSSPDVLESLLQQGDIVILSNRYESQLCAIEMGVSLLIVCDDAPVPKTIQKIASDNHVSIMSVPYDTYAAGKLISQCAPVSYFMQPASEVMKFSIFTTVETATSIMAKVRHRYFPILDEDGKYCGMLSRRNVMKLEKRKIILVDHNETTQAIEGFDQSEILEIIDHHRIGSMETTSPAFFRNQPLGSTCSIIAQMYEEQCEEITPAIAGLLLSGILSDTLKFTSPTSTPLDKVLAEKLAVIAGVSIDTYAENLFAAAEDLEGKTGMDILRQDFKMFVCGEKRFGISQGNFLTKTNLKKAGDMVLSSLREMRLENNLEDIYVMLTDIQSSTSYIICNGTDANRILQEAFPHASEEEGVPIRLDGIVSRKKQFLPKMMEAYQNLY